MDWKRLYLSFDGRINRKPFWIGLIVLGIVNLGVQVIISMAFPGSNTAVMLTALVTLVYLYPMVAIYVKRCHDRGKSGWWCLLLLVPLVGALWALIDLGILKGTDGPNDYGPDPLGSGARADVFD